MEIRLILAALRRHKLTAALLVLQVALTCAILTNAVFLITQAIHRATVPSGLDEAGLSIVTVDDLGSGANPLSVHQADLAALRRLPGIKSAALVASVPFDGAETGTVACGSLAAGHAAMQAHATVPGCAVVAQYEGGPGTLRTLGLKLAAGRDFRPNEYTASASDESGTPPTSSAIIVSETLAAQLFPGHPGSAVGRVVYYGMDGLARGQGTRVVGVVKQLHGMAVTGQGPGDSSALVPIEPTGAQVEFAFRTGGAAQTDARQAAVATLLQRQPQRDISGHDARTYAQIRAAYFSRDVTMITLLLAATLGLLFVTAMGIAGLANFWVGQRTRSIGIRRALGATRSRILRYFQIENFLIVTAGVTAGTALAIGLNLLLMPYYEVARLPMRYLTVGAVAMWVVGQISVLSPALRASRVPPLVAARGGL